MAINPLISLQTQVPDVGAAIGNALTNVNAFNTMRENQQTAGARKQLMLGEADQARLKSMAITASQILPMMEANDAEGVRTALTARRDQFKKLGLDTRDMDEGLMLLDQDPALLKQRATTAVQMASMFDKANADPSAVQEFKYYEALPDQNAKDRYLNVKRSGFEVGGVRYDAGGKQIVSTEKIVKDKGAIAGGEAAGKSSIEKSNSAIEGLTKTKRNILNIDTAISAIDSGAKTGAITSYFPSIKAASVELDNARGQMGLDLIGATTFGALSKGELDFALDTSIPRNLNEQELKKWLVRKKAAQQKMAAELEAAAIYLGTPGNTPAGYLEFQRNQRRDETPPTGNQGQNTPDIDTTKLSDDELLSF